MTTSLLLSAVFYSRLSSSRHAPRFLLPTEGPKRSFLHFLSPLEATRTEFPLKNRPQRGGDRTSKAMPLLCSALGACCEERGREREGNTETVVHSCYSYISPVILCGFGIRRRRRKCCCLISLSELPRLLRRGASSCFSLSAFDDVDVVASLSRLQFRQTTSDSRFPDWFSD